MTDKRTDKTIWELAIEERDRLEKERTQQAAEGQQDMTGSHGDESSIFVLGSKSSGKTTIILRFLDRDEAPKSTTALDYTFGRRAKGHNIAKDIGHIWELGGGTFLSKLIDIPINVENIRSLAIMIVLDLSKPTELWNTMETLLTQVKKRVNTVLEELSVKNPNAVQQLKKAAWKKFGEDHPEKSMIEPFPVPLAIVGAKFDIYQDFDPEKRKMISRVLRFVAHTNGAHLQFFSTKQEGLTNRTRGLFGSLLFKTAMSKNVSLDHNKPIIVPSGHDSLSQIGAPPVPGDSLSKLAQRNPYHLWKSAYASVFPPEDTSREKVRPEDPALDPQYAEPAVDNMRAQKDEELQRYRKMAERKAREAERNITVTTGVTGRSSGGRTKRSR